MNASAILMALQPLANLAHEAMKAHYALRLSLQYTHRHHTAKAKLESYINGVEDLSSKALDFPKIFVPPTYLEHIPKLRSEADQRLADIPELTVRVEQYIENPPKQLVHVDQREIYALLNEVPVPTIGIFHAIGRESQDRAFNGIYYPYSFLVDPLYLQAQGRDASEEEWTHDLNGPRPSRICVRLKNGISQDEFEKFGKALPDGAVREEYARSLPEDVHKVYWVVGLTGDEREVLLLHPLVKGVYPFQPKFNIALAFD